MDNRCELQCGLSYWYGDHVCEPNARWRSNDKLRRYYVFCRITNHFWRKNIDRDWYRYGPQSGFNGVDYYRDELDLMAMQQTLFEKGVKVVPGTQTFTPGSGNFTVPLFNTFTIEVWGAGGGGGGFSTLAPYAPINGTAGGGSSIGSLSAGGGG